MSTTRTFLDSLQLNWGAMQSNFMKKQRHSTTLSPSPLDNPMLNLTAQKSTITTNKLSTSHVKVHGPHHNTQLTDLLGKFINEKKD